MTEPVLHIDFETRSTLDLREVGLHRYARHPTTDVWCMSFALGEQHDPELWNQGDFPCRVMDGGVIANHVTSGGAVMAHNAPFELEIWNQIMVPRYGWPELKPEQTYCTMAMAYAMGLPGNLEDAALAMGLSVLKDAEGRALMLRMARPRSKPGAPLVWWDEPEKLARLYAYCQQDVRVERELHKRLMPLSAQERKVWLLDYKINQRGVALDMDSVRGAVKLAEIVKEKGNAELAVITNGAVQTVSAVAAFKQWLEQQNGRPFESLAKQEVVDFLAEGNLTPASERALTLRQEIGKASTAKFDVMLNRAGDDNRLRQMYQYHGAGTGRWAGRAVQTHNLPRNMPKAEAVERIMELVRAGDHDMIDAIYGAPLSEVSRCLRSFFWAPPGKLLCSGDFANVEGRGQAWFAGEQWKLDAFRAADAKTGPGIYELAYSRMFNVPVESVKNPSEERQVGKVCLAGDTQVVTDRGILAISDVTTEVQVWDGVEFVKHNGLLHQGLQQTINLDGVSLTPEHLVLTNQTWLPAKELASSAYDLSRALASGSENLPSSVQYTCLPAASRQSKFSALAGQSRTPFRCTTSFVSAVHAALPARKRKSVTGARISGLTPTSCRTTDTAADCSTEYPRVSTAATIPMTEDTPTTAVAGFMCSSRGAKIVVPFYDTLRHWMVGISRTWNWIERKWTAATSRVISVLFRGLSTQATDAKFKSCKTELHSLKPVYDLANAGPRRRFTIKTDSGFLIVHNCELAFGYQGGAGSFHVMAKAYGVKVSDAKAEEFKNAWRAAHPRIKSTWYAIEKAATSAVANPGETFECGWPGREAKFKKVGSFLWCLLPSGRAICFPYPKLLQGMYGPQLTYMTVPGQDKSGIIADPKNSSNWARISTYGGSLFNNIVQGFSRDLLADLMLRMDAAGAAIVLHTHDDCNIEVDTEKATGAAQLMQQMMRTPPAWAAGFPLWADVNTMRRYGK